MKIAVIGDNCIDVYLSPVDKKYIGGCAVNVAISLAHQGIEVSYLGIVGTDYSDVIITSLQNENIDISHVLTMKGRSGITEVKIIEGEKTPVLEDLGVQREFAVNGILTERQLSFLSGFDFIYYSGFASWKLVGDRERIQIRKIIENNLRLLDKLGGKIIFDYAENNMEGLAKETSHLVDYAFFSMSEMTKVEAIKYARKIVNNGSAVAVITRGANGAIVVSDNKVVARPALDVDVIDTLGAGDSFIGAFIAKQLLGDDLEISLEKALEVSADICQQLGGGGMQVP